MSSKIKDIKEFSRLFRVRIPWDQEFDYYIRTLSQSEEYAHLPELADEFAEFESFLARKGERVGGYKMDHLRKVKDFLGESKASLRLRRSGIGEKTGKIDRLSKHAGRYLISIDIEKANYNMFRSFDEEGALPEKWSGLVKNLGVHPILAKSKSWRQLVFGGVEPKATQKCQYAFIEGLWSRLEAAGWTEEDRLLLGHDEIVIAASKMKSGTKKAWASLARITAESLDPDGLPEVPEVFRGKVPLKLRIYRITDAGGGVQVQETYSPELELKEKSLFGVPGNRYFVEFKRHILEAPIEEPDLYFINEHRLAKWVVDESGNHLS